MKTVIAALVLVTISALATDLTGNWSGGFQVDGGDHNVNQRFTLRQQGKSLSGSGGPDASEQYPIEKGSVEGSQIRFQVMTGEWKFTYHLRQSSADTLQGDLQLESVNDSRTAKVSLTRVKGDGESFTVNCRPCSRLTYCRRLRWL
jgi:hypothetical protein